MARLESGFHEESKSSWGNRFSWGKWPLLRRVHVLEIIVWPMASRSEGLPQTFFFWGRHLWLKWTVIPPPPPTTTPPDPGCVSEKIIQHVCMIHPSKNSKFHQYKYLSTNGRLRSVVSKFPYAPRIPTSPLHARTLFACLLV